MIADPRAVAARWGDPRMRAIAALATAVTEAPWTAGAARSLLLDDATALHVVALSAFFGHLNRIADATGVPLDYQVVHAAPAAEPATPAYDVAPAIVDAAAKLSIADRPATAAAFAAWHAYLFDRVAPLSRATRAAIAARADAILGRAPAASLEQPSADLNASQRLLVDVVIRQPWALGEWVYRRLRLEGADDATLFDLCTTASTASLLVRIDVALRAMA